MKCQSISGLAALTILALVTAGCQKHPGSGHGRVLDVVSKRPVPGAEVTVICAVASSWHGTRSVEHTATSTAPNGAYFLDPAHFRSCADIYGLAKKPGYVPNDMFISGVSSENKGIPEIIYVLNESDIPELKINAIWRATPVFPLEPGPYAVGNFASTYRAFNESRRIADSTDLAARVRELYCARLYDTYSILTPAQREQLVHEGGFHAGAEDYATEILTYCTVH